MADYKLTDNGVMHQPTSRAIPADPLNRHWREYQAWLADGNTPDPADEITPGQLAREAEMNQAPLTAREFFLTNPAAVAFIRLTPAEQAVQIDAMTLAQLKVAFKYVVVAVSALVKQDYL